MPDTWEYPWYAAWDLAFHTLAFADVDPAFAKEQLLLFLREWYMHPNGQLPAYEWSFSDVNPPVHAWACWRIYKMTGQPGARDRVFLARAFQKLTAQLHVVGEPQGRGREQPLLRRLPRPRQHRRLRPQPPAPGRRPARAGRRHGVDGLLRRDDALDRARAREGRPRLRGHGVEVLRALRRDRGGDEHVRRHGPLGRAGRLLLRPPLPGRRAPPAPHPVARRARAPLRGRDARGRRAREAPGVPEAAQVVPCEPQGPRGAGLLPRARGRARPRAPRDLDPDQGPPAPAPALRARRAGVPLSARRAVALAPPPGRSVRPRGAAGRRIASSTNPASRGPASSAATRTGGDRSGSR